ncbi:NADPH-dependent FMN reductase [Neobacillus sp. NPDC097160]|uniref:NADPH-dependent FMN reductase n=1 Tax=Neobacillus sp. NPDC097160 TaxID=3364298 RepID=UPI003816A95A
MKILGISGTLIGRKTLTVIEQVINEIKSFSPEVDVDILDLRKFNIQFCDGRTTSEYTGDTKEVIERISLADGYIIGTPIFQGSFTGALKNLLDLVPPSVFQHKVMGFVATGGNPQHYLVVENQLKPIAGYFKAIITPHFIFANSSQFNKQNEIVDSELNVEIKEFSHQVLFMMSKLSMESK